MSLKPRKLNFRELKIKNKHASKPRKCRKISVFQVNFLLFYCIGTTVVTKRIRKV